MTKADLQERHSGAGHSSQVTMQLLVGDQSLRIAQLGPDFLVLAEPAQLAPTTAEIVLQVDGRVSRRAVRLPEGATAADPEVPISSE